MKPFTIMADNQEIEYKLTRFSDNTFNINIPDISHIEDYISVTMNAEANPQEIILMALMVGGAIQNGLQRKLRLGSQLRISYLPNARADRVFNKGDTEPLRMFNGLLGNLWLLYNDVYVEDAHNPKAIHPKLENISGASLWADKLKRKGYDYIITPDSGAVERCSELSKAIGVATLQGEKKRSLVDGSIERIGLCQQQDLSGLKVVVFDDICDGGGTFIPYAKEARAMGAVQVDLVVTHGIFAKGLDIFKPHFDNIHVRNFVGGYINATDILQFNN